MKDLQCGWIHNLALSVDGDVYAWGNKDEKQCGVEAGESWLKTPRRIEFFDEYIVDEMKVGSEYN